MLAWRRSRVFLLDTVDRGAEFVEILKTVYPKAESLHEKDFDWLFDCPQTEQFLEWFCNTVSEENILTVPELDSYEKLLVSGKPILEGEALEEVLKTCHQTSELKGAPQGNGILPLETLEQEMQLLKSQYACLLKRYNKLQVRTASLKQELCFSAEMKEKASRELKKAQLRLELENFQSNDVLSQAGKTATEVLHWHKNPRGEGAKASLATEDLRCYLESEEIATKAFKEYLAKVMPGIIGDMEDNKKRARNGPGGSQEEPNTESPERRVQEVLLKDQTICAKNYVSYKMTTGGQKSPVLYEGQVGSKNEPVFTPKALPEKMDETKRENFRTQALNVHNSYQELKQVEDDQMELLKDDTPCNYPEELKRMELAYMWSQILIVMTSANIKGIASTLQWARKVSKSVEENKVEEERSELCFRIATCQEQLCILQKEVDQAKTQQLVPLLQESIHLFCLPIVSGELDLEAVRLGRLELMQEETTGHLLGQLSHLELLRLLLMLEKKKMQNLASGLEGIATVLKELHLTSQEWESCSEDSRFSIKQCPRTLIDPNDLTTLRLWEMLDKHSQEKQLFRTYETLASRASRLCQEIRMLQVQLATPFSHLPKLEMEKNVLHNMMYGDTNQLMLHAQELSEPLEQLHTTQAKLYQMLMDTLSDLKAKHKSLQSHFQQTERSLYVHFFNNPDRLKELVEAAEKQTLASSYV
ncbi:HAUS augmin-like complex subunit 3 [Pogona vitticeps]